MPPCQHKRTAETVMDGHRVTVCVICNRRLKVGPRKAEHDVKLPVSEWLPDKRRER
jgi:hypothetical protein